MPKLPQEVKFGASVAPTSVNNGHRYGVQRLSCFLVLRPSVSLLSSARDMPSSQSNRLPYIMSVKSTENIHLGEIYTNKSTEILVITSWSMVGEKLHSDLTRAKERRTVDFELGCRTREKYWKGPCHRPSYRGGTQNLVACTGGLTENSVHLSTLPLETFFERLRSR